MTRDEVKDFINVQEPTFLSRASKRGYICPFCNQGARQGNGITRASGRPNLWHCIGCDRERSVTGLFAGYAGVPDDPQHLPEILDRAAAYYGITIDADEKTAPRKKSKPQPAPEPPKEPAEDYSNDYRKWATQLDKTDYFSRRGISAEIVKQIQPPIGYDPDWINPVAVRNQRKKGSTWTPPSSPRVIMPSSGHAYTARDTRANLTPDESKNKKQKIGEQDTPFNAAALSRAKHPVFVTEGEINALSIMEAGKDSEVVAVATGSAAYTDSFVRYIKDHPPAKSALPLLISMDNDAGGQLATARLKEALTAAKIPYQIAPLPNPTNDESKDANDLLLADPAELKRWTLKYTDPAAAHMADSAGTYVQAFLNGVTASADTPAISTGFQKLDAALSGSGTSGGFYPGLYFMGAISSLGKTTFALQICDAIAQGGNDVLIFSLEMSRYELIAKSLSRLTAELAVSGNINLTNAKSARGIMDGARYRSYNPTELKLITTAAQKYEDFATERIWIFEGVGNIGASQIRAKIAEHMEYTGRRPVVLIDYLQILSPADPHSTDKQNTDKNVLELKRISRDFNLPLLCISSFNRESYTDPVSLRGFKESGNIEYSADVLIGLQYQGMEYQEGDYKQNGGNRVARINKLFKDNAETAKQGKGVNIELKILKNRNSGKDISVTYTYYPVFNYFQEV